jgi:hypothetical protein
MRKFYAYGKLFDSLDIDKKKQLEVAQKVWLDNRDSTCGKLSDKIPDPEAVKIADCISKSVSKRADELEKNTIISSSGNSASEINKIGWYKSIAEPSLIVRNSPDITSEKLGNVPPEGKVNVLEYTDKKDSISGNEGTWVKIEWKDSIGYAFNAFLKPIESEKPEISEKNHEDIIDVDAEAMLKMSSSVAQEEKPTSNQGLVQDIKIPLGVLFEGAGLMDSGKYSPVQIEALFEQNYKNMNVLVSGEINNIGKSFSGKKYLTIKLDNKNYVEVYPEDDFNVLDFNKGQNASFTGKWTEVGTGIMIKHKVENAMQSK